MVLFYSKVKVDWRRLAENSLLNLDVTFGPGGYVKSQDLDPKYFQDFQGTEMGGEVCSFMLREPSFVGFGMLWNYAATGPHP